MDQLTTTPDIVSRSPMVQYICGGTEGSILPSTTGAFKPSKQGVAEDGYIARFNAQSGALIRSTLLGQLNTTKHSC